MTPVCRRSAATAILNYWTVNCSPANLVLRQVTFEAAKRAQSCAAAAAFGTGPTISRYGIMPARVSRVGDLWGDLHAQPTSLGSAIQKLSQLIKPEQWQLGASRLRRKGKPRKPRQQDE